MVADHVHHGRKGAAGIVHVGQGIGHAGPGMKQCGGGFLGHAGIAVGGPGHDTFEQAQDAAHLLLAVQRGNEVHFRRSGIGETHIDVIGQQRVAEGIRPGFARLSRNIRHVILPLIFRLRSSGGVFPDMRPASRGKCRVRSESAGMQEWRGR